MSILTRWEPFGDLGHEMRRMQRQMERLLGRRGFDLGTWPAVVPAYPPVNLWEDADYVYAEAELPGLKLEDLDITVSDANQLALRGKREPLMPEKVEWHRQERSFGSFERILTLPVSVDVNKVEARLENGVLMIKMAKSPTARARRIPVRVE